MTPTPTIPLALLGLIAGTVLGRHADRLRAAARTARLARSGDGQRAVSAFWAIGVEQPTPALLSLAIAVVRACDAERTRRPYRRGEDDNPFVLAALNRVRVPEGLPALDMLVAIPALVSTDMNGDVLSQSDGLMSTLAASIADATMDPAHAQPLC